MTSRLNTEKYANNTKKKYLVSGQSLWRPARAQLASPQISASTLAPALPVFLRPPPAPPYHIQTTLWEDPPVTLPLTAATAIATVTVIVNGTVTVKEAFSKERESATESVNARPRSVSVNAKGSETVNNASPRGSNRIESRAIGLVGVHLNTLVVS